MKEGFDNKKYVKIQSAKIRERFKLFDKLYLEVGGKLFDDSHAARILPGFKNDAKISMFKELKNDLEIIFCINAGDIEKNKTRGEYGITYDTELLRLINTSNYSFSYDEEVLKNNKELFDYYFRQSLDILTTYTSNIVIIPLYNSLINRNYEERLNNLVNQYNSLIKEISDEYNVKYINVNKLSSFVYVDNHVNMNGYNYLLKNIK